MSVQVETRHPVDEAIDAIPGITVSRALPRLQDFTGDRSQPSACSPVAIFTPKGRNELQALVEVARTVGLRLLPVSSGVPHYRGDTLAAENTAIVDMSAFSSVVRVDRRNRVALLEAGVRFPELTKVLANHGLRPLLPLVPRNAKSALAAYLEREPTIYPRHQWDLADPLLCTEVIFGTGEHFRTGSAAGPGSLEDQWAAGDAQTNPMGPGQSDLMRVVQGSQGTVGIATWCSIKCRPVPTSEELFVFGSADLGPLVEAAYHLLHRKHPEILFLGDRALLSALTTGRMADVASVSGRYPQWFLAASIAEPPFAGAPKMRLMKGEIGEMARLLNLQRVERTPGGTVEDLLRVLLEPSRAGSASWREAGKGNTAEVFFLTTLDRASRFVDIVTAFQARYLRRDQEPIFYIQPLLGGRSCHFEASFPHAPEASTELWRQLPELVRRLRAAGAFFSRPYGALTAAATEGSPAARLVSRIQGMFDPDSILSPGNLRITG
ncbi:MAG: FAD-binding oxidoreductase [Candidatus Schekmanbacteria bacterium]|nr:FAD-binding oxidoreductase [Candidatus Schekmanbacteria bacterium]